MMTYESEKLAFHAFDEELFNLTCVYVLFVNEAFKPSRSAFAFLLWFGVEILDPANL